MARLLPQASYVWHCFVLDLKSIFIMRWDFCFKLLDDVFRCVAPLFVWNAVFQGRSEVHGYTREGMLAYVLAGSVVTQVISTSPVSVMSERIGQGEMTSVLLKPIGLFDDVIAGYLSDGIASALALGVIATGVGFYLQLGGEFMFNSASVVVVLISMLVTFLLSCVVGCASFWMVNSMPIVFLMQAVSVALSGALFPLDVLPESLGTILSYLPTAYMGFYPIQAVTKGISDEELRTVLLVGVVWILAFGAMLKPLFRSGLKSYDAVGG